MANDKKRYDRNPLFSTFEPRCKRMTDLESWQPNFNCEDNKAFCQVREEISLWLETLVIMNNFSCMLKHPKLQAPRVLGTRKRMHGSAYLSIWGNHYDLRMLTIINR